MPSAWLHGNTSASSRSPQQSKPTYCPEGYERCKRCNRLMPVGSVECAACAAADAPEVSSDVVVAAPGTGGHAQGGQKPGHAGSRRGKPKRAVVRDDGVVFESISQASVAHIGNVAGVGAISAVCRGRARTAYGHSWKYADQ